MLSTYVPAGFVVLLMGLAGCQTPAASRATFNVVGFGAVGDGKALDTVAFRHAIEACRQLGGGTVRAPRGTYLLQPIDLCSGLTLLLDPGAVLIFSDDPQDYPLHETRWEGIMRRAPRPSILASKCSNVAIVGGTINGAGARWWAPVQLLHRQRGSDPRAAPIEHPWETNAELRRPPTVQFRDCSGVRIEGVTFENPPQAALHLLFCNGVRVMGAKFLAPEDSPNTSGIEVDSTTNVLIENCTAEVGGDAFVLCSGKDEDGRKIARATASVTIRGCTVMRGTGGAVIGAEMSGGISSARIADCRFENTEAGLAIRSMRGRGGAVTDVRVTNLQMRDVGTPFTITMRHRPTAAEPISVRTPRISGIQVSGVSVRDAARAGIIEGLEEMPMRGLSFRNLNITARYGISCSWADDVEFRDVIIATDFGPAILRTDTTNLRLDNWNEATRPLSTQPAVPATRSTTRPGVVSDIPRGNR